MKGTPAAQGFRMPAEWEPHAATWLAWPHERTDWPGKFPAIPLVYADLVRWLTASERVRLEVNGQAEQLQARRLLKRAGVDLAQVDFFPCPTDRVWTRDHGPLFVKHADGEVALTHWRFNGWAKYANHLRDDAVPDRIARAQKRRQWKPMARFGGKLQEVVLEGGSIDVNGAGTLLTTEECLLSPIQARNPGLSQPALEALLQQYLGIRKVLWLGEGIVGDDTHGHVDDLARFVDETTVVLATERKRSDANYARLEDNRRRLQSMTDAKGRPLHIVPLPMPRPVEWNGQRLPASYANFYIANRHVLVPTFNDPADRVALGTLARLFPSREVVGIHALDLVWGLGTLHCMTQQEPA
ncbi:MAG: agmatine/peptidylarginine deiminase [Myxococcaceae bacterium]